MNDKPYSKSEIDLLFQRFELTIKNVLLPLENKIDNLSSKVESVIITTGLHKKAIEEHDDKIRAMKSSSRGAVWAFSLTVPLLLGLVVWIFANEVSHLKEAFQINSL